MRAPHELGSVGAVERGEVLLLGRVRAAQPAVPHDARARGGLQRVVEQALLPHVAHGGRAVRVAAPHGLVVDALQQPPVHLLRGGGQEADLRLESSHAHSIPKGKRGSEHQMVPAKLLSLTYMRPVPCAMGAVVAWVRLGVLESSLGA